MQIIPRRSLLLAGAAAAMRAQPSAARKTRNVIFVMTDGFRWQELFEGADPSLMNKENGGVADADVAALRKLYWRDTPEQRREALLPFLWTTIARQGQIFGNRALGSDAYVANNFKCRFYHNIHNTTIVLFRCVTWF